MAKTDPRLRAPEELAEIGARAEKITAGPWFYDSYNTVWAGSEKIVASIPDHPTGDDWTDPKTRTTEENILRGNWYQESQNNAFFFQHARTDIPSLLDHAAAQQEKLAAQEERFQELEGQVEAAEAENVRLLELFALVPHAQSCAAELSKGCVVDCRGCEQRRSPLRFGPQIPRKAKKGKPCNCIKSKVII